MSGGPTRGPPRGSSRSNLPLVAGLALFVGGMGLVPLLLHRRQMRIQKGEAMWSSSEPLSATATRRGPYLNTSSTDVGPDPDWDHAKGTYKGKVPVVKQ